MEPLLLQIKRSQLRWFGHVSRMPQENFPNKLFMPKQMGKNQMTDLELDGPITLRILDGITWTSLKRNDGRPYYGDLEDRNLELLPRNPHGKAGNEKR